MKKYTIQLWATEWEREQGFSITHPKKFTSLPSAVTFAKKLFKKDYLASIEVVVIGKKYTDSVWGLYRDQLAIKPNGEYLK